MSYPKKIFALDRALFFIIAAIALLALTFGCQQESKKDSALANPDSDRELATPAISKQQTTSQKQRTLPQNWKDYWYAGKAEITSYKLEQARYGEMRQGTATLIYVTEDFLPKKQVKADRQNDNNIPVLKLNTTKKFNTGIYPYSLMTSTFYPVFATAHAIKISHSMQEWCGLTHVQLNSREDYEIQSHSYFESKADTQFNLPKAFLENELWTQLRIDPKELPTGSFDAIPDFGYAAMKHVAIKTYSAKGTLTPNSYTLTYPELERSLTIKFYPDFPYSIQGWEETYPDGGKQMTTRATIIKTIKSAYWSKNKNSDTPLRKELELE